MNHLIFIWEENHVSIDEDNPPDKVNTIEEKLDAVKIDGIGNLVNLPRLMFIYLECGNLKVFVDGE